MAAGLSHLILLDREFRICGMTEDYFDLVWTRRYYQAGGFAVSLAGSLEQLRGARFLYHPQNAQAAIIENVSVDGAGGNTALTLRGRLLESLLDYRVINEIENISGNLEASVRALVSKYAMTGERAIALLTLGAEAGFTEKADVQLLGDSLMDSLYALLRGVGLSYRLDYNFEENAMSFEVWQGRDRTTGQTDNDYAIFSSSFGNIHGISYTDDTGKAPNYSFVTGADGQAAARLPGTQDDRREAYFSGGRLVKRGQSAEL